MTKFYDVQSTPPKRSGEYLVHIACDNDLISRKALLEEVNKIGASHMIKDYVIAQITNAPTIEADSGEAVAYVSKETAYYFGISQKNEPE